MKNKEEFINELLKDVLINIREKGNDVIVSILLPANEEGLLKEDYVMPSETLFNNNLTSNAGELVYYNGKKYRVFHIIQNKDNNEYLKEELQEFYNALKNKFMGKYTSILSYLLKFKLEQ